MQKPNWTAFTAQRWLRLSSHNKTTINRKPAANCYNFYGLIKFTGTPRRAASTSFTIKTIPPVCIYWVITIFILFPYHFLTHLHLVWGWIVDTKPFPGGRNGIGFLSTVSVDFTHCIAMGDFCLRPNADGADSSSSSSQVQIAIITELSSQQELPIAKLSG